MLDSPKKKIIANLFMTRKYPVIVHTITGEEKEFNLEEWLELLENKEFVRIMTNRVKDQLDKRAYKPNPELDKWTWQAHWRKI